MAYHNEVGKIGEDIAVRYLEQIGYHILDRNFRRKWGEIDIIAQQNGTIHFVEVKSVSYETKGRLQVAVTHGTWRPEENVTKEKVRKLNNAIETWLAYTHSDAEWQLDVVTVRMVPREKYAQVKVIENIIME